MLPCSFVVSALGTIYAIGVTLLTLAGKVVLIMTCR